MIFDRSPVFNLSAVLKETGLKADILRAWERRYDLPKPQRTSGGHRLYSEHDIETVKWLRTRQGQGLSISRAVDLWKGMLAAGRDPFGEAALASPASPASPASQAGIPTLVSETTGDTTVEILRGKWLEAGLALEGARAEEILNQAFAMLPVETVCTAILQQGLNSIGKSWQLGKVSVQQEHFVSAMALRRIEVLISAAPLPTRSQTLLLGCPSGEWHTFSSLLLHLFLRRKGFNVAYLGADVPVEQMEETAAIVQPHLVILLAQQLSTAAVLQSAAAVLRQEGVELAYGGLIFNRVPRLRERIPAHFLGESLDAALQMIESFIISPVAFSLPPVVDHPYQLIMAHYQEKRPLIEHTVVQKLKGGELDLAYIHQANAFFGSALAAALQLGDLSFAAADLEWVRQLLAGRQISSSRLIPYLAAYNRAVRVEMGDAGDPITDWITAYVAQNQEA